jgi:hypothetical protein
LRRVEAPATLGLKPHAGGKAMPIFEDEPEREDADASVYWSVDDCRWESVEPTLPDDLVDLLAPPIVVGAARA